MKKIFIIILAILALTLISCAKTIDEDTPIVEDPLFYEEGDYIMSIGDFHLLEIKDNDKQGRESSQIYNNIDDALIFKDKNNFLFKYSSFDFNKVNFSLWNLMVIHFQTSITCIINNLPYEYQSLKINNIVINDFNINVSLLWDGSETNSTYKSNLLIFYVPKEINNNYKVNLVMNF
jgi:hypothetical protein